MSHLTERGAPKRRSSALWGTGKGGERPSVLWGKGGRGLFVAAVSVVALALPVAATASPAGKGKPTPAPTPTTATAPAPVPAPPPDASNGKDKHTFVAKGLLDKAKGAPNTMVDVIITSSGGTTAADRVVKWLSAIAAKGDSVGGEKKLNLVNGVTLSLPAKLVALLQTVPGLTVTPDAPVRLSGLRSTQVWPYASGNAFDWAGDVGLYKGQAPAIAIVDSGIENRADFGSRIVASVNLSTLPGNTDADTGTTDQRGHGTFVAGIAAGAAPDLAGAAPGAPLVSVKVMDAHGVAKTSDVIAACQWILDNKAQYNIRVANFSLHSSYGTNSYRDPLDKAVEQLWFNGVVVVAAAGNYGTTTGSSGVLYAPGNDPFVITVGAIDNAGTVRASDDTVAPWSAYGYTEDGFWKPDVSAPGRYMVGPVPAGSTVTADKPANMVGTDRIQLSGTSFAAPVVAGTVADMLARHPSWTPDQVKGALMFTARKLWIGNRQAAGMGELTASRAVATGHTPNPNAGLDQFVSVAPGDTSPSFDAMSWASVASTNMSWNSMSWASMSWSDMSWSDQSWSDMSWSDMSWSDQSWSDMSWSDMSWSDMSREDAAEADAIDTGGYVATDATVADAATDPDTAVPVDGLDPTVALGIADPAPPTTP